MRSAVTVCKMLFCIVKDVVFEKSKSVLYVTMCIWNHWKINLKFDEVTVASFRSYATKALF